MPDCAIFADTKGEPASVYRWLDYLDDLLPFPIHRVSAGSLEESEVQVRRSKKSGRLYINGKIPAFMKQADGRIGLMGRRCTSDFKIVPIQQQVRKLLGITRGTKDTVPVTMYIGISYDEVHRMKPSRLPYIRNTWPLVDAKLTRAGCLAWMKAKDYPEPPRSACRFCPFHSDDEWRRLKDQEPAEFDAAVAFENALQAAALTQEVLSGVPFLHSSAVPLGQVVFAANPARRQIDMFGNECEGLCGV
jgi:hypothetical protein